MVNWLEAKVNFGGSYPMDHSALRTDSSDRSITLEFYRNALVLGFLKKKANRLHTWGQFMNTKVCMDGDAWILMNDIVFMFQFVSGRTVFLEIDTCDS